VGGKNLADNILINRYSEGQPDLDSMRGHSRSGLRRCEYHSKLRIAAVL